MTGVAPQFNDITWKALGQEILVIVAAAERSERSDAAKRRWAIAQTVEYLDAHLEWGEGVVARLLEQWDGPAVRAAATVAVEVAVGALDLIPVPVLELLVERGIEAAVAAAGNAGAEIAADRSAS